jgi:methyltransferase
VATLGRFWTTRVISVPTTPLIRGGPFRWIRHPNYLAIALQLPLLLYAYAAPGWAAILGAAHILLLAHRIRVEEEALRPRRSLA